MTDCTHAVAKAIIDGTATYRRGGIGAWAST
jgi:hypothetical protein